MKNYRSFTLVEVLIASAIFIVVMVAIYSAFHSGIFGYRNIEDTLDLYQASRLILERINLDLKNSFIYQQNKEAKFLGSKDAVSFLTLVDTFGENKILPAYAYVSYKLEENKLLRLCRKNQESLNEKSEVLPEEMSSSIQKLDFSYGYIDPQDKTLKFKDSWGTDSEDEKKNLPEAVKVSLTLKGKRAESFERTIYLTLLN